MKQNSFIYLRGLKHAAFTVFCVENGQKFYYDPQFNVRVPFSSGQQVKRSFLEKLNDVLGVQPSPQRVCSLLRSSLHRPTFRWLDENTKGRQRKGG